MFDHNYSTAFVNRISSPFRLLCLFIAFLLLFRQTKANCSHQFFFREDNRPTESQDENSHQVLPWTFFEDTKQCDDELSSLLSSGNFSDAQRQEEGQRLDSQQLTVTPCVDQLLDIELTPLSVFPVGKNILPYVQLNISVNTFSSVDQLFFRFRCIFAPNSADYLCHNHSIQLEKWGQMIWPCRKLQIERNDQHVSVPQFHFSYTCFRLFSLSQYAIEFFVFNRNELCRRELLFTIPMEQQLDPKIADFYNAIQWDRERTALVAPSWSPLVALDTSFDDCLFVQLHPSEWLMQNQQYRPKTINVAVFSTFDNDNNGTDSGSLNANKKNGHGHQNNRTIEDYQPKSIVGPEEGYSPLKAENSDTNVAVTMEPNNRHSHHHFLVSQKVPLLGRNENTNKQNNFYRLAWVDIDAGNYTLFAFVEQGDCHLACHPAEDSSGDGNGQQKCRVCPHTALNFTLTVAKHSAGWHRSMLMTAFARNANFCVLGILFFLLIALVVAFLYVRIWRPRALARLPPHHVELDGRCPTVLVLYTDDCQEHSDAVLALCRTLEESANAKCFVDQWAFVDNPTLRPSLWLVEKLAECDFVLVIFSPCSVRVMAGEQLVQRRHFPDLFNSGLGFIVSRIREIASSEGVILSQQQQLHQNGHIRSNNQTKSDGPKNVPAKHCQGHSPSPKCFRANDKSLLNRFIFARFACADPSVIPPFFASSQFGIDRAGGPIVLPDQVGLLIARLHGVVSTAVDVDVSIPFEPKGGKAHHQRFLHEADLSQLNEALERLRQFVEMNPNWMEQRFISSSKEEDEEHGEKDGETQVEREGTLSATANFSSTYVQYSVDGTDNGTSRPIGVPTIDEQAQIAAQYGLLAVEDEDEEDNDGQKKQSMQETNGANGKRYHLLMVEEEEDEEEEESGDEERKSMEDAVDF
ncbi:hypothetical protein niasHS_001622 [Heterodera schachtii]|uniref:SEFIR domain-containing protein n=1 Tax=Heterodera schachtii TaxID=97005 RepID=A0ABD2KE01_HETSC